MEEISQNVTPNAPQPATPFEAYVINQLQHASQFEAYVIKQLQHTSQFEAYVMNRLQHASQFETFVINQLQHASQFETHVINQLEQISKFEAYVVTSFKELQHQITEAVADLSESIRFVANQAVTKDEFYESMGVLETRIVHLEDKMVGVENKMNGMEGKIVGMEDKMNGIATKEDLKKCATKEDLGAVEHRIKSYIDDRIVMEKILPLMRAQDTKVDAIVSELEREKVFTGAQAQIIKKQGPFGAALVA